LVYIWRIQKKDLHVLFWINKIITQTLKIMAKLICKFCAAENETPKDRCFSCNAPLPQPNTLNESDEKSLSNFITSTNKTLLAAKTKAETMSFLFFGAIAIVWAVLSFMAYSRFPEERTMIVVLIVVMAVVAFILFGGMIGVFEQREMGKSFHNGVKDNIIEYLTATGYSEADFQHIASKTLKENAPLLVFMVEI